MTKVSFKEKQMRTKDPFVRIPRKQMTPISSDDIVSGNSVKVRINKDDNAEKYPNMLIPEKLFLMAKEKELPLHIVSWDQEFFVSEAAVKVMGPYTHRNEGTKIKDNAPATLITLLKQKVEGSGGSFHKETVRSLAKKAKQPIPECREGNSDAGERLVYEATCIYNLAESQFRKEKTQ